MTTDFGQPMKAHPTNPHGVLVPCATCGTEMHLPKADFELGGVGDGPLTCSYNCMLEQRG